MAEVKDLKSENAMLSAKSEITPLLKEEKETSIRMISEKMQYYETKISNLRSERNDWKRVAETSSKNLMPVKIKLAEL